MDAASGSECERACTRRAAVAAALRFKGEDSRVLPPLAAVALHPQQIVRSAALSNVSACAASGVYVDAGSPAGGSFDAVGEHHCRAISLR